MRNYKYSQQEQRWYYMDKDGEYTNYYKQATLGKNTEEGKQDGYYNSTTEAEYNKA